MKTIVTNIIRKIEGKIFNLRYGKTIELLHLRNEMNVLRKEVENFSGMYNFTSEQIKNKVRRISQIKEILKSKDPMFYMQSI